MHPWSVDHAFRPVATTEDLGVDQGKLKSNHMFTKIE